AADGRPIPEAHGFFIAQDGEQSRSVVLCLRLQGQAICLEDHGPAALSAARPSSRRSALKSVHWTDLTRYAGRASPCKKTERRPAAFSAVTRSHCTLQTGPWAGPQPETKPRGVSPNRPSANSANCAGDRRLRNGFAWS